MYEKELAIYALNNVDGYHFYNIYSLSQKKYIDKVNYYSKSIYYLLPLSSGEIMRFHERGISINNGEIDEVIYLKKLNENFEIFEENMLILEDSLSNCFSRGDNDSFCWSGFTRLNLINLDTKENLWSFKVNEEKIHVIDPEGIPQTYNVEYINAYNYNTDLNNDGKKDLVILLFKLLDFSQLIALDGETGEVISEVNIVIPKDDISIDNREITEEEYNALLTRKQYHKQNIIKFNTIRDLSGDGVNDYYIVNDFGEIYFFDMTTGEILTTFTSLFQGLHPSDHTISFEKTQKTSLFFSNYMVTEDMNNDSIQDFIIYRGISYSQYYLIKNNNTYSCEFVDTTQLKWGATSRRIGDVDGDGTSDISYIMDDSIKNPSASVILSKTGDVFHVTGAVGRLFLNNHDVNHDGLNEVLSITRNDNRFKVNLYDLATDQKIFESNEYFMRLDSLWEDDESPAIAFINKEGEVNVAIILTNKSKTKSKINIYNLNNELINEVFLGVQIENEDEEYNYLGNMKSFEYNDLIYIYGVMYNSTPKSYLYNASNDSVTMIYNDEIDKLSINSNHIVMHNPILQKNVTAALREPIKIMNIKDEDVINKEVTLSLMKDSNELVNIYVDNYLVGQTKDHQYSLTLLEGEHEIKVSQIDANGIEMFYKINVVVKKEFTYPIIIVAITIILFSSTLFFSMRRKYSV